MRRNSRPILALLVRVSVARDVVRGVQFTSNGFFSQVPKDFQYAVEIHNASLLGTDYRKVLETHSVAHVYNHWSYMPPLAEQYAQLQGFTALFTVLRLLTPLKMSYEAANSVPSRILKLWRSYRR